MSENWIAVRGELEHEVQFTDINTDLNQGILTLQVQCFMEKTESQILHLADLHDTYATEIEKLQTCVNRDL